MITRELNEIIISERDLKDLREVVRALRSAGGHPQRRYAADLEAELDRARVVPDAEVPDDVVTMNSTVRIRDQRTREVETFTLVYPHEADVLEGRVSVLAPLGLALLGTRAGEVVRWQVPAGVRTLKVQQVTHPPATPTRCAAAAG